MGLARRRVPIVHMNEHLIVVFHLGEACKHSYSRSWWPRLTDWQTQEGLDAQGLVHHTHERKAFVDWHQKLTVLEQLQQASVA